MSSRNTEPRRCQICGRPPQARFKPFCSSACADIDLSRWLEGRYAIPAQEEEDEADSPGSAGDGTDAA
ncbi:MAG TPA: DNA gyrase inhibitor YacG [Rhizomicrobium sp.]|jgi:hypothetical protein|nr:DNA gyrase inhibitor YacG [Rhizomicrobium sp.]